MATSVAPGRESVGMQRDCRVERATFHAKLAEARQTFAIHEARPHRPVVNPKGKQLACPLQDMWDGVRGQEVLPWIKAYHNTKYESNAYTLAPSGTPWARTTGQVYNIWSRTDVVAHDTREAGATDFKIYASLGALDAALAGPAAGGGKKKKKTKDAAETTEAAAEGWAALGYPTAPLKKTAATPSEARHAFIRPLGPCRAGINDALGPRGSAGSGIATPRGVSGAMRAPGMITPLARERVEDRVLCAAGPPLQDVTRAAMNSQNMAPADAATKKRSHAELLALAQEYAAEEVARRQAERRAAKAARKQALREQTGEGLQQQQPLALPTLPDRYARRQAPPPDAFGVGGDDADVYAADASPLPGGMASPEVDDMRMESDADDDESDGAAAAVAAAAAAAATAAKQKATAAAAERLRLAKEVAAKKQAATAADECDATSETASSSPEGEEEEEEEAKTKQARAARKAARAAERAKRREEMEAEREEWEDQLETVKLAVDDLREELEEKQREGSDDESAEGSHVDNDSDDDDASSEMALDYDEEDDESASSADAALEAELAARRAALARRKEALLAKKQSVSDLASNVSTSEDEANDRLVRVKHSKKAVAAAVKANRMREAAMEKRGLELGLDNPGEGSPARLLAEEVAALKEKEAEVTKKIEAVEEALLEEQDAHEERMRELRDDEHARTLKIKQQDKALKARQKGLLKLEAATARIEADLVRSVQALANDIDLKANLNEDEYEQWCAEVTMSLDKHKVQAEAAAKKIAKLKGKISTIEDEEAELEEQVTNLRREANELERAGARLAERRDSARLSAQRDDANQKLMRTRAVIDATQKQTAELAEAKAAALQAWEDGLATHADEVEKEVADLASRREEFDAVVAEARDRYRAKQRENVGALKEKQAEYTARVVAIDERMRELRARLEGRRSEVDDELTTIQREITAAGEEEQELERETKRLQDEHVRMKEELEEARAAAEDAELDAKEEEDALFDKLAEETDAFLEAKDAEAARLAQESSSLQQAKVEREALRVRLQAKQQELEEAARSEQTRKQERKSRVLTLMKNMDLALLSDGSDDDDAGGGAGGRLSVARPSARQSVRAEVKSRTVEKIVVPSSPTGTTRTGDAESAAGAGARTDVSGDLDGAEGIIAHARMSVSAGASARPRRSRRSAARRQAAAALLADLKDDGDDDSGDDDTGAAARKSTAKTPRRSVPQAIADLATPGKLAKVQAVQAKKLSADDDNEADAVGRTGGVARSTKKDKNDAAAAKEKPAKKEKAKKKKDNPSTSKLAAVVASQAAQLEDDDDDDWLRSRAPARKGALKKALGTQEEDGGEEAGAAASQEASVFDFLDDGSVLPAPPVKPAKKGKKGKGKKQRGQDDAATADIAAPAADAAAVEENLTQSQPATQVTSPVPAPAVAAADADAIPSQKKGAGAKKRKRSDAADDAATVMSMFAPKPMEKVSASQQTRLEMDDEGLDDDDARTRVSQFLSQEPDLAPPMRVELVRSPPARKKKSGKKVKKAADTNWDAKSAASTHIAFKELNEVHASQAETLALDDDDTKTRLSVFNADVELPTPPRPVKKSKKSGKHATHEPVKDFDAMTAVSTQIAFKNLEEAQASQAERLSMGDDDVKSAVTTMTAWVAKQEDDLDLPAPPSKKAKKSKKKQAKPVEDRNFDAMTTMSSHVGFKSLREAEAAQAARLSLGTMACDDGSVGSATPGSARLSEQIRNGAGAVLGATPERPSKKVKKKSTGKKKAARGSAGASQGDAIFPQTLTQSDSYASPVVLEEANAAQAARLTMGSSHGSQAAATPTQAHSTPKAKKGRGSVGGQKRKLAEVEAEVAPAAETPPPPQAKKKQRKLSKRK